MIENYESKNMNFFDFKGSSPSYDEIVSFTKMADLGKYAAIVTKGGVKGISILGDTTGNLPEEAFIQ